MLGGCFSGTFTECGCFGLIILIAILCLCSEEVSCFQVLLGVAFAATLSSDRCGTNNNNNNNGNNNNGNNNNGISV